MTWVSTASAHATVGTCTGAVGMPSSTWFEALRPHRPLVGDVEEEDARRRKPPAALPLHGSPASRCDEDGHARSAASERLR